MLFMGSPLLGYKKLYGDLAVSGPFWLLLEIILFLQKFKSPKAVTYFYCLVTVKLEKNCWIRRISEGLRTSFLKGPP